MSKLTRRADGRAVKKITINGKAKYFYSTKKSDREAERDINQQMMNYHHQEKANKSFKSIAEKWCEEYRANITDINFNKNTRAIYERIRDYFLDIKNIDDLTIRDINIFITMLIKKGYYKKTVANHKSVLNMICSYAVLNGFTKYNPVSDVKLPANLPKKPRKIPTTEEIKEVSSHYTDFDLLPYFMLYTGCRKSEALAIRYEDIDFENKSVKIQNHVIHDGNTPVFENILKTENAEREIILLDRVLEVIPKKRTGFLFSMNGDGKEPLTKKAYDNRWASYCKKYNLKITAHQLRNAYATMLYEAGIGEKDAQELMGHSDINLTRQIYTHIRDKRKEDTKNKLNSFKF